MNSYIRLCVFWMAIFYIGPLKTIIKNLPGPSSGRANGTEFVCCLLTLETQAQFLFEMGMKNELEGLLILICALCKANRIIWHDWWGPFREACWGRGKESLGRVTWNKSEGEGSRDLARLLSPASSHFSWKMLQYVCRCFCISVYTVTQSWDSNHILSTYQWKLSTKSVWCLSWQRKAWCLLRSVAYKKTRIGWRHHFTTQISTVEPPSLRRDCLQPLHRC